MKPQWYQIDQWWQVAQKNGDHDDHGHLRPRAPQNRETIGTPISDERGSRSQGNMGTPERPEVKTAFYSQISQAWQGPVKTSAFFQLRRSTFGDSLLHSSFFVIIRYGQIGSKVTKLLSHYHGHCHLCSDLGGTN